MATSEGIPSSIDIEFLELNDNPYYKGTKILENKDDSELNNYNKTNKITRLVTNLTYVAIVFGQPPPSSKNGKLQQVCNEMIAFTPKNRNDEGSTRSFCSEL